MGRHRSGAGAIRRRGVRPAGAAVHLPARDADRDQALPSFLPAGLERLHRPRLADRSPSPTAVTGSALPEACAARCRRSSTCQMGGATRTSPTRRGLERERGRPAQQPDAFTAIAALPNAGNNLGTSAAYVDSSAVIPQVVSQKGVVDAGTSEPGLTPGARFSIRGWRLAGATTQSGGAPVPSLAGVEVRINGQVAPIFSVSPTQVDALVPVLGAGTAALTLARDGVASEPEPVEIKSWRRRRRQPAHGWELKFGLNPASASGVNGATATPTETASPTRRSLPRVPIRRGTVVRYFAEGATSSLFEALVRAREPVVDRSEHPDAVPEGRRHDHEPLRQRRSEHAGHRQRQERPWPRRGGVLDHRRRGPGRDRGPHDDLGRRRLRGPRGDRGRRSGPHVVPGRRRHPQRLRPVLPAPEPLELVDGRCACGTSARRACRSRRPTRWRRTPAPTSGWTSRTSPASGRRSRNTDVSAVIESVDGVPIIVERAMYRSNQGRVFNAGHESAGITTPATRWFLAEGATGPYFDLFVLLANPNGVDAQALVDVSAARRHHLHEDHGDPGQLAPEHLGGCRHAGRDHRLPAGRHRRLDDRGGHQRRPRHRRARHVVAGRWQQLARGAQLGRVPR